MMAQPALFETPGPSCVLSACERYRYRLYIPLSASAGDCALFIMANPSTAVVTDGVFQSDPTITRCINFARSWGSSSLLVGNVRAWRETHPENVPADPEAIGPENDEHLARMVRQSHRVICGWGKLGGARGSAVLRLIRDAGKVPFALKLNKDGSPAHPLYLAANSCPVEIR